MTDVEVVTVPVSEELGRAIAIAENDRDVTAGLPVNGPMLDAFEDLDRDIQRQLTRAVIFGEFHPIRLDA